MLPASVRDEGQEKLTQGSQCFFSSDGHAYFSKPTEVHVRVLGKNDKKVENDELHLNDQSVMAI